MSALSPLIVLIKPLKPRRPQHPRARRPPRRRGRRRRDHRPTVERLHPLLYRVERKDAERAHDASGTAADEVLPAR